MGPGHDWHVMCCRCFPIVAACMYMCIFYIRNLWKILYILAVGCKIYGHWLLSESVKKKRQQGTKNVVENHIEKMCNKIEIIFIAETSKGLKIPQRHTLTHTHTYTYIYTYTYITYTARANEATASTSTSTGSQFSQSVALAVGRVCWPYARFPIHGAPRPASPGV